MYFDNFPTIQYDINGIGTYNTVPALATMAAITAKIQDEVAFYSYYNILDGERPDNVSQKLYGTPIYYWTFFLVNPDLNNFYEHWPKGGELLNRWIECKYMTTAGIVGSSLLDTDKIEGKFVMGETIRGSLSNATGTLVGKYPTNGYIELDNVVGTFKESGESLSGLQSQDTIVATSVVSSQYAPHHHIDNSTGDQTARRAAGTTPVTFYEWEQDQDLKRSRIRVIKPEHIRAVADEFFREINK